MRKRTYLSSTSGKLVAPITTIPSVLSNLKNTGLMIIILKQAHTQYLASNADVRFELATQSNSPPWITLRLMQPTDISPIRGRLQV